MSQISISRVTKSKLPEEESMWFKRKAFGDGAVIIS